MLGINGWEIVLLAVIAVFVLGPDRMPEYAAKLARGIRKARVMAEGAKGQLKEQLGPEYDDINWRQYDPRQYDPRRIVKQALLDPIDEAISPVRDSLTEARDSVKAGAQGRSLATEGGVDSVGTDEDLAAAGIPAPPTPNPFAARATPWDTEAT